MMKATKNSPKIGKNVIETLTSGMYDDPRYVFREYVQNAADQIDVAVEQELLASKMDGKILITVDKENRRIIVEDNATGIQQTKVRQFLGDVANSEKDFETRKGFRGIGRLGGLGYCEKLVFETSYEGELVASKITLNAKQLKQIIEDRDDNSDAARVISIVTKFVTTPAIASDRFFRVTMENVTSSELLDIEKVREYLSVVAPVPFSVEFSFTERILRYFALRNFMLDEYFVSVNESQVFKAYRNSFVDKKGNVSRIIDINFFEVRGDHEGLIGLCWYAIRDLVNVGLTDNVIERGIRIRKSNITIGDGETMGRFFSSKVTNHRYVGEFHVLGKSLVPNARRDYFNENATREKMEQQLKAKFDEVKALPYDVSLLHNRLEDIAIFRNKKAHLEEKGAFKSKNEEKTEVEELRKLQKKATEAKKVLEKIRRKATKDKKIEKLFKTIIIDSNVDIDSGFEDLNINMGGYPPITFRKLSDSESSLVLEIFDIIDENLDVEAAESLKQIILKRYN